jgi:hypothetical protein
MNTPEDNLWTNLVAMSAPAYPAAGEATPFGFTTRMLAQLRTEERQQKLAERIGLRAIFAAFAILVATGMFTLGLNHSRHNSDLEPGLRGFLQAANTPLS